MTKRSITGISAVILCALQLIGADGMASPTSAPLRADQILADIKHRGAQEVLKGFWKQDGSFGPKWDEIADRVARGGKDWLQVAAALRPATDAGASETLDEAVFLALKPSPVKVLRLLREGTFETQAICSSIIGIDYDETESRRFIQERIEVLAGVSEPSVRGVREECLKGLRGALADIGEH
jgi:hypothetical protein